MRIRLPDLRMRAPRLSLPALPPIPALRRRAAPAPAAPAPEMTAQELLELKERFDKARCLHCGGIHERACPRVRRIAFAAGGQHVSEVEFWPDGRWSQDGIVWPHQLFPYPDAETDAA